MAKLLRKAGRVQEESSGVDKYETSVVPDVWMNPIGFHPGSGVMYAARPAGATTFSAASLTSAAQPTFGVITR